MTELTFLNETFSNKYGVVQKQHEVENYNKIKILRY